MFGRRLQRAFYSSMGSNSSYQQHIGLYSIRYKLNAICIYIYSIYYILLGCRSDSDSVWDHLGQLTVWGFPCAYCVDCRLEASVELDEARDPADSASFMLRADIGFCIGTSLWPLLESLPRIHVFFGCQTYWQQLVSSRKRLDASWRGWCW